MDNMSISRQVRELIGRIEPGAIFGLKDFSEISNLQAVTLELSRLSKKGTIERLTKGKYFVPKQSRFGKLQPEEWRILDKLIKENGGYFAGAMALNRFGVTTQVPSQIMIRGARSTRMLKIGNLEVQFLRQGNPNASANQSILTDIIEAVRLIKRTPDGDTAQTLNRISSSLKNRTDDEITDLLILLKNERPYVRAVVGALLENAKYSQARDVKAGLNPLTKYRIGIEKRLMPNKESWGII